MENPRRCVFSVSGRYRLANIEDLNQQK
jgi:hypothetical protein